MKTSTDKMSIWLIRNICHRRLSNERQEKKMITSIISPVLLVKHNCFFDYTRMIRRRRRKKNNSNTATNTYCALLSRQSYCLWSVRLICVHCAPIRSSNRERERVRRKKTINSLKLHTGTANANVLLSVCHMDINNMIDHSFQWDAMYVCVFEKRKFLWWWWVINVDFDSLSLEDFHWSRRDQTFFFSTIDYLSLNRRLVSNSHFSLSVFRLRLNIQLKSILNRHTNSLVKRQTVGHLLVVNWT